jgi:hypothetical protein
MSEIKYLLDEHVDPRLRKALKQLASDIICGASVIRVLLY